MLAKIHSSLAETAEVIRQLYLESISNALDIARTEDDLAEVKEELTDRKSTRLNSSHSAKSRMPSSA